MPKMKPQGTVKVTFEVDDRIITCTSPRIQIGKDSWNGWEDMVIHSPYDVKVTPKKEEAPVPPEAWKTPEPAVDPVKAAALKHVKLMARKIERTKLANARRVEEAHETGQANLNFAAHDFNEAVLSATHEGIEYEDIQAHLTAEGIHGLSHDVACASGRDWDLLYPSVVE